jgi:nitroreductase
MSYPEDVFSRMFGGEGGGRAGSKTDQGLLYPKKEEEELSLQEIDDTLLTNKLVEDWKVEMIFAAADTAPTAGGFQGFEIYNIKNQEIKLKLVEAANKQPYVNAPVVLVFCMNPDRIKMNFPHNILKKFSLQDSTLAAAYAQLAAHALGLSSIWIGMIDEQKIMSTLGTGYIPASILCLGYPQKILQPKPKRSLRELIHEV